MHARARTCSLSLSLSRCRVLSLKQRHTQSKAQQDVALLARLLRETNELCDSDEHVSEYNDGVLQCVVACCSVLQSVAVCCNMLWESVFWCVAECH